MTSDAKLKIQARICGDPRLISSAKLLDIPKSFCLGSILHLFCQAMEYAEDGDLWRGDEEPSLRFAAALADWPGDAALFVSVLQQEGWLDGWMIADWLDYAGDHYYRKYKSHNRSRLMEIHAKNGREYGKGRSQNRPDASHLHPQGCSWAVNGMEKNHPITPNPKTLIPKAPNETKNKDPPIAPSPMPQETEKMQTPGGVGGGTRTNRIIRLDQGDFFDFDSEGLLDRGIIVTQNQLDGSGFSHRQVFEAYKPALVFHSILTIEAFYYRCLRCGCTPAWWTMVYQDKIHAVYRQRPDGNPWLEEGADPVALTMAATLPSYGRRHTPTEASRQLFLEVMIDYQRMLNGEKSKWLGCVSGGFICKELDLRKGKAGKIA